MTDEIVCSRHQLPERCPECGEDYTRTWTNDARPLGTRYRRFEHDATDDCLVPIAEADQ